MPGKTDWLFCHSRAIGIAEGNGEANLCGYFPWIPAFAGMTADKF